MKTLLLLLANGFEMYEAAVFTDVFGWNQVDGDGTTRVVIAGTTKELKSTFGVRLVADIEIKDIRVGDYDALAVPGGFEEFGFYDDVYRESFLQVIRDFHAAGKPIAAICTGGLPVAKSGILTGKKGTTYSKNQSKRILTMKSFGVDTQAQRIVEDANVITCWDPSTAIDVSFRLLEKLTSANQAAFVRSIMGFAPEATTPS